MMGVSNFAVRSVDTFPRTLPGLISPRRRKIGRSTKGAIAPRAVSVGEMLPLASALPENAVLLGCCADRLPFLMSMNDPEMGAILIRGDRGCGKTHQLQVVAEGAIQTHRPHELQITVICHDPSIWAPYQQERRFAKFFQGVYAWYDPVVGDHIQRLTEMVEARRDGRQNGPANLVILDDMVFVETLSFDAQVNLRWLLEYGAQSQVWLFAAMNNAQAQKLPFWLEVFRTQIFGWMKNGPKDPQIAQNSGPHPETLEPGTFRAWTGRDWITYRLPLLGPGLQMRS